MPIVLLFVGAVLMVAAFRNTVGDLGTALQTDVPPFVVWAAAILGIGAIGYVPGLKPISRALLALVFTVLLLTNYKGLFAGYKALASGAPAPSQAQTSPGEAYATSPKSPGITSGQITGTSANINAVQAPAVQSVWGDVWNINALQPFVGGTR